MANLTDTLENALLNHMFSAGVTAYAAPLSVQLALCTTAPTDAVAGTEVGVGVGYARQTFTSGAAAAGSVSNDAPITFGPNTTTNWGSITHVEVYDNAGARIWWGPLTIAKAIAVGDSLTIAIGSLTFTLN